jgi:hypothetical protein
MIYTPLAGGWLRVGDPERGTIGYVKLSDVGGRLVAARLYIQAVEESEEGLLVRALRGSDLREFPLATVEAVANASPTREQLLGGMESKVDLAFKGGKSPRQVGEPIEPGRAPKGRLKVPEGRSYGDDFYRRVAEVYGALAVGSSRPAVVIAEANGVPVRTVHRWIYEARRRGFLPAGSQGRAG